MRQWLDRNFTPVLVLLGLVVFVMCLTLAAWGQGGVGDGGAGGVGEVIRPGAFDGSNQFLMGTAAGLYTTVSGGTARAALGVFGTTEVTLAIVIANGAGNAGEGNVSNLLSMALGALTASVNVVAPDYVDSNAGADETNAITSGGLVNISSLLGGGGGGGTITSKVEVMYAEGMPLTRTNQIPGTTYTNLDSFISEPVYLTLLAYDDTTEEMAGPQSWHVETGCNSNIVLKGYHYAENNCTNAYGFYWWQDGGTVNKYTTDNYLVTANTPTNLQQFTWATQLVGLVPGQPFNYLWTMIPSNSTQPRYGDAHWRLAHVEFMY